MLIVPLGCGTFTSAFAKFTTSYVPFAVIVFVPVGVTPVGTSTSTFLNDSTSNVPFSVMLLVPVGKTPCGTFTSASFLSLFQLLCMIRCYHHPK